VTLLELCKGLAKNVGIAVPTVVYAGTDRTAVEMLQCANDTGEELARRVDWGVLRSSQVLTGDGTNIGFTLTSPYNRLSVGAAVTYPSTKAIIRQLTVGEASTLSAAIGAPRYYLLEGTSMRFWPYIPNTLTAVVRYQSDDWCDNGATNSNAFAADSDTPRIPDRLLLQGMIVRWRRQKGMDYADFEAEYEATIAQMASFDEGARL
jgi:hypothetical protein